MWYKYLEQVNRKLKEVARNEGFVVLPKKFD
jgi:hypothetical protein